jgi:hypothetical protein
VKSVDKIAFFFALSMKRVTMAQLPYETGSGNVFVDLDLTPAEAAPLAPPHVGPRTIKPFLAQASMARFTPNLYGLRFEQP